MRERDGRAPCAAVLKSDMAAWQQAHPGQQPPGSLKGLVRVQFVNEHGVEEAGVDGGGLFKDFLSALIEEAFDPVKTGLFVETPDRTLYPNPASYIRAGPDHLRKLEFLGAILGKAVYEGILVDLPLAGFFLAKLRDGRPPELNDLATLDPELYRHLLSLKRLPADQVEDLFLFFTAWSVPPTKYSRCAVRRAFTAFCVSSSRLYSLPSPSFCTPPLLPLSSSSLSLSLSSEVSRENFVRSRGDRT